MNKLTKKRCKKRRILNWKNSLLFCSLLLISLDYLYLFFFSNIELSPGFWAILIWVIVVVIGITIYTLGIKSVINRDDLPKKFKKKYKNIDKSNTFSTNMTYIIILVNVPCWYLQQSSPVVYLPIVILILAIFPWGKLLKPN